MVNQSDFDEFFRSPSEGKPDGVRRSNLFILRRDLAQLYLTENALPVPEPRCPMLTAIGMLSGIDLMAWITTWPNEPGRQGFVKFLHNFGGLSQQDSVTLYQFRCAQMHSYGLYNIQQRTSTEYKFTLTTEIHIDAVVAPFGTGAPNEFKIGFWALKKLFLNCIQIFREQIEKGHDDLSSRFSEAAEKISFVYVNE